MSTRGFCAIGIEGAKTPENVGTLWRSAHALGAAYIFTIGARYPKHAQRCDTSKAWRHIPFMEFETFEDFQLAKPRDCELVVIECGKGEPESLVRFSHPERAMYVLGAEDRGVSPWVLDKARRLVSIPSAMCLNVATTGSIVLYDRVAKQTPALNTQRPPEEGS